jgi:predicted membrane-bound dolichyl-phosphate-mannose-protein mannosyltransferase
MLGALGGVIASIVMYPFLFLTTSMMGIPLDDLSIARGMAISNINDNYYLNLVLGIGMHLVTGAISGAIFAILVSKIKKFRIINYKRGIVEGIVFSIVIFLVLYIPTTVTMVHPNLLDIMNQSNPAQTDSKGQKTVEQNLIPIYGFGFMAHIVFGAILGFMTSLLIFRGYLIQNK